MFATCSASWRAGLQERTCRALFARSVQKVGSEWAGRFRPGRELYYYKGFRPPRTVSEAQLHGCWSMCGGVWGTHCAWFQEGVQDLSDLCLAFCVASFCSPEVPPV